MSDDEKTAMQRAHRDGQNEPLDFGYLDWRGRDDEMIRRGDALDALVSAMNDSYISAYFQNKADFHAIRTLPAVAPRVKALEWVERYGNGVIKLKAESPFGAYHIDAHHEPCAKREDVRVTKALYILAGREMNGALYHGREETLEAAQAAAQADYEARILAALDLTP